MIGCLRTRVRKQPIVALYFESIPQTISQLMVKRKTTNGTSVAALSAGCESANDLVYFYTVNSELFVRVLFYFRETSHMLYAKFRENKVLANWLLHSAVY